MRRVLRAVAAIALAACFAGPAGAREATDGSSVSVRLEVPAGPITVGDPVVLTLRATHPPGAVFDFPDAAGAFARIGRDSEDGGGTDAVPMAIVDEVKPLPQTAGPGETVWSIRMRLFKPGDNRLPSLSLTCRPAGGGDPIEAATEPVVLKVESVLKDSDEKAAGDKGPWRIPADWTVWLIGGAAALALAVAVWILARRLKGRRRPQPAPTAAPEPPVEPPYVRALRELEALLASTLLAEGRIKEFHVALSEIVKRFLGAEHGFDALDRTTEEVLADLTRHAPAVKERVRGFLQACDLVKFARHRPPRESIDETVREARGLIDTARRTQISSEAAA